jgi:hypothetical protein
MSYKNFFETILTSEKHTNDIKWSQDLQSRKTIPASGKLLPTKEIADRRKMSLESLIQTANNKQLLTESFFESTRRRRAHEAWLFKNLNDQISNKLPTDETEEIILYFQSNDDEKQSTIGCKVNHDFIGPIQKGKSKPKIAKQVAPYALNRWGARFSMREALLDYGIIEMEPNWSNEGWSTPDKETPESTLPKENPEDASEYILPLYNLEDTGVSVLPANLKEWMPGGPDILTVKEYVFDNKKDAQKFVDNTRNNFRKGNHDSEVLNCEVRNNPEKSFVAIILEADKNWAQKNGVKAEREEKLEKALKLISSATTKSRLDILAKASKRYSRNQQVLESGRTIDDKVNITFRGKRYVYHVGTGMNYKRHATIMNAIFEKAKELRIPGFRRYKINPTPEPFKPNDKNAPSEDIMEKGCKQGEFLTLNKIDESQPLNYLWGENEDEAKPSQKCLEELKRVGPLGFKYRTWNEIKSDVLNDKRNAFRIAV